MALREWLFSTAAGTTAAKTNVVAEDATQATTVGLTTGTGTILFSTLHAQSGNSLEFVNDASSSSVVRLPHVAAAKQGAVRFYHWSAAPGGAIVIGSFRHASGQLFRLVIHPEGEVQIQTGAGVFIGKSVSQFTYGQLNRFEVVYTVGTSTTTGNVAVNVYPGESGTASATLTLTGVDLGTADCSHIEFGTPTGVSTAWTQYVDSFATNNGATTEIGPRVTSTPLATPVVTMTKTEPLVYGGTGSFTATWPAVSGAGSYKVSTPPLPGDVTTGTPTTTTITATTYTWTAQPAGTYTVTVQAIPA